MDKIAIISDIHGCLVSLETVMKDIEKRGINKIFCLGDLVAKGSMPKEAIEVIKEKCEVVLKGNCDDVVSQRCVTQEHFWNREKIGEKNVKYLISLPMTHEFYISGQKVILMHTSPKSLYDYINLYNIDNTLENQMDRLFEENGADIAIFGHVHRFFMCRKGEKSVISDGCVSNGCDIVKNEEEQVQYASYLILEGKYGEKENILPISFEFVKIPYDYRKEISNLEKSDMPNKDMAIKELKSGKYVAR